VRLRIPQSRPNKRVSAPEGQTISPQKRPRVSPASSTSVTSTPVVNSVPIPSVTPTEKTEHRQFSRVEPPHNNSMDDVTNNEPSRQETDMEISPTIPPIDRSNDAVKPPSGGKPEIKLVF